MAATIRLSNPIWWIQLHLMGGWRRVLSFCAVYLSILVACSLIYRRMEQPQTSVTSLASALLGTLSMVQIIILLFWGFSAVSKAVSRDMRTQMIESHRLSAMDALGTMWGYLLGPSITVLLVWSVGTLYGVVLCGIGLFSPLDWLAGSGLLLLACLSMWALVVFCVMVAQKPMNMGAVGIGLTILGQVWVTFLPGAGIALSVYSVIESYGLMNSKSSTSRFGISVMIVASVVTLFLWILAAARKYRSPQRTAFGPMQSVGLLIIWLVACALGTQEYASFRSAPAISEPFGQVHFIGSLLLALVVGIVPLHSLASAEAYWIRSHGTARRTWTERLPVMVYALLTTVLICLILGSGNVSDWSSNVDGYHTSVRTAVGDKWVQSALGILMGILAWGGLLRFACAKARKMLGLSILFIVVIWVAPVVGDAIWASAMRAGGGAYGAPLPLSWVSGCSSPGTLIAVWTDAAIPIWPGLAVQAVVATVLQLLGIRAMNTERRRCGRSDYANNPLIESVEPTF